MHACTAHDSVSTLEPLLDPCWIPGTDSRVFTDITMNVSIFSMLLKFCSLVTDFFTLYQPTNQQAKRKKKRKKEKNCMNLFICWCLKLFLKSLALISEDTLMTYTSYTYRMKYYTGIVRNEVLYRYCLVIKFICIGLGVLPIWSRGFICLRLLPIQSRGYYYRV